MGYDCHIRCLPVALYARPGLRALRRLLDRLNADARTLRSRHVQRTHVRRGLLPLGGHSRDAACCTRHHDDKSVYAVLAVLPCARADDGSGVWVSICTDDQPGHYLFQQEQECGCCDHGEWERDGWAGVSDDCKTVDAEDWISMDSQSDGIHDVGGRQRVLFFAQAEIAT